MFTSEFWRDALERAVSTAAQAAIAYLGTIALVDDLEATWKAGLLTVGIATAVSLLKSLAAGSVSGTVSPASTRQGARWRACCSVTACTSAAGSSCSSS